MLVCLGLGLSLLVAVPGSAQTPSAGVAEITAAYLFNFVKFTEWPGDEAAGPVAAPVLMCVTDADVARAAAEIVAKRPAGSRPVDVVLVTLVPVPRQCGVLYAGGLNARQSAQLTDGLKGSSVLTVGDSSDFTKQGGILYLFIQGGNMRFGVNVDAASRARLRLSSKLLNLAVLVKD